MVNIPENNDAKQPDISGEWKDPYSKDVLLSPEVIAQLRAAQSSRQSANVNYEKKRQAGFLSVQEAADKLQAGYMLVYKRASKIVPDKDYTPFGLEATPNLPAVKGNVLVWKNPYGDPRDGKGILLNPTLVNGWQNIFQKQKELRSQGYKTIAEAAEITGFDRDTIIEPRTRKIKPNKHYSSQGLSPSVDDSVLGSELIWRDPYGITNAIGVLISPKLIEAWKKSKEEEQRLRAEGYKTYNESEQLSGMDRSVLEARVALINANKQYSFDSADKKNPVTLQGSKLVWRSAYSMADGSSLIHPLLVEFWKQQETKEKELRAKGYKTVPEASAITELERGTIHGRANNINPDEYYASNGLKPDKYGTKIKGDELVWRGAYQLLLHPEMVEGWKLAQEKEKELIIKSHKRTDEVAEITGLKKYTVLSRARNIDPDSNYTISGFRPKENEHSIKGSELIWRNPYSLSSDTGVLIHEQLLQAWKEAELLEKALRNKGYLDIADLESYVGLSRSKIHKRIEYIEPETNYTEAGLTPKEGESSIKGKDLCWRNPYSNIVIVHPKLAEGWKKDFEQQEVLIAKGYKRLKEVEENTGIDRTSLIHRLKAFSPEQDYSPEGLTPTHGGRTVKGKDFFWRSAYSDKMTLIHPELAAGWKEAVDKEKSLIAKGYKQSGDVKEITGLSTQQLSKRALEFDRQEKINGDEIIWTDPYSNKSLFHPYIVQRWQSSVIKKGAESTKVGDIPVPNDNLKRQLDNIEADKQKGL